MKGPQTFAELLRHHRAAKGLSARGLSLRAGLGPAYVHNVELGRWTPRPDALRKLERALDLTSADAVRFREAAGIDSELRTLPIPNLAIWKHLPELLFSRPHQPSEPWQLPTADDMLHDSVRAVASLLAWVRLEDKGASQRERAQMLSLAQRIFESSLEVGHSYPVPRKRVPEEAALRVASALPLAWRAEVFRDRRASASLVALISRWNYIADFGRPGLLSIDFKSKHLRRYAIDLVACDLVTAVHDLMVAHQLWRQLDIPARLGLQEGIIATPSSDTLILNSDVALVLALDLDAARHELLSEERAKRFGQLADATCRLTFADRLYDLPVLADTVLGCPRDLLRETCNGVETLLDEITKDPGEAGRKKTSHSRG